MTTEERIDKLERDLTAEKRRNRWMLGCGTMLILGCFALAAIPADKQVIRAKEFIVVDDQGRDRIKLYVDSGGPWNQTLWFIDEENGTTSTNLSAPVALDGPGLAFLCTNGHKRAWFGLSIDGPSLAMGDEKGNRRVKMEVNKKGAGPMLSVYGENGETLSKMLVKNNEPMLWMQDENGKGCVMLSTGTDGPLLSLYDENEKPRASLSVIKNKPSLYMLDANKKSIWSAP